MAFIYYLLQQGLPKQVKNNCSDDALSEKNCGPGIGIEFQVKISGVLVNNRTNQNLMNGTQMIKILLRHGQKDQKNFKNKILY